MSSSGHEWRQQQTHGTPKLTTVSASKKETQEASGKAKVVCSECDKTIEGKIVSAMGKTFHPEHFICHGCKKPITGGKFNQHEGKPYCEADFVEMYLKKCAACGKPIKDKMIIAMDKNWHEDHFVCEQCKKPLGGQSFVEKDGKAFCQPDYHELYSPRCHGCRKPITDTAIVALEERWHHQCFRCSKCGKPIMEKSFEVVDNKAICASCSGNIQVYYKEG